MKRLPDTFILLVWLCASASGQNTPAQDSTTFCASGRITLHGRSAKFVVNGSNSAHFTVCVAGHSWSIRLNPIDWPTQSISGIRVFVPKYVEMTCDGTNVFMVRDCFLTNSSPQFPAFAKRTRGIRPQSDSRELLCLWYAFASACYLDQTADRLPVPFQLEKAPVVHASVERSIRYPHLPVAVTSSNGIGSGDSITSSKVVFRALSETNCSGISLPLTAKADYSTEAFGPVPWCSIVISTEVVEVGMRPGSFIPNLNRFTLVSDELLPSGSPDIRVLTNRWFGK